MRAFTLAAAAVAALALAGLAAADGDPASDYLFQSNTFLPQPPPSHSASAGLGRSVAAAYARGYRVKVAVIATKSDLGAASSLFGQPGRYAQFLGTELAIFYAGPLLVVMPSGYGIYDSGRSTAAEERVLARLHAPGATADTLTASATGAVQRMTATGALRSKDIRAPLILRRPVHGQARRDRAAAVQRARRQRQGARERPHLDHERQAARHPLDEASRDRRAALRVDPLARAVDADPAQAQVLRQGRGSDRQPQRAGLRDAEDRLGERGDQLDVAQVVVRQVLEHHPLDARLLELP